MKYKEGERGARDALNTTEGLLKAMKRQVRFRGAGREHMMGQARKSWAPEGYGWQRGLGRGGPSGGRDRNIAAA